MENKKNKKDLTEEEKRKIEIQEKFYYLIDKRIIESLIKTINSLQIQIIQLKGGIKK